MSEKSPPAYGPGTVVAASAPGGPLPVPRRLRHAPTRNTLAAAALLVALAGAISGCGTGASSSAPPPGAAASGPGAPGPSAAAATPNAPDPNAPEINPAGDVPDNQVYVPYSPSGAAFTVSVPQGWAQQAEGPATVFTDKFNSVRIESGPRPGPPTVATAQAQEIPQLQATVPGFAAPQSSMVNRPAGPALLITYTASSPPNPVTGKSVTEAVERYTFWKAGQQVTLTLSAPQGSDNVDPWRMITNSFRWQR